MISGGISIKGSYHDINQDYFISKAYSKGHIIVVSDGMGSKKMSQYGSEAICESVYEFISTSNLNINAISFKDVLYRCYELWKKKLYKDERDINECYATLLVILVMDHQIKAARLGDGFISVYVDDEVHCLFDEKEDCFSNETDCLSESFDRNKLEVLELKFDKFHGALACTDGVEIGIMQEKDIKSFSKEFIEEYSKLEEDEINKDIQSWLSEWTGSDDKTLAYMLEGEL